MQLIECVPNFSEGRNPDVIHAITAEIEAVTGIRLLDVDPGSDTNRTVVTFVGAPDPVAEAAFRAIVKAAERIDMRNHRGAHPRMGATDVCPFVPIAGVSMEQCAELARRVAVRVGEYGIPVYLYEHAATGGRRSLADVRHGEYESLASRPDRPDFGPDRNDQAGATAIGAREFLIAYNVNLNTTDRKLAHEVAQSIRELGTPRRDAGGHILRDEQGKTIFDPGRFRECKAVGWYLEDYGRAQVSINLTDYKVTSLHDVFEACVTEAEQRGMRVTGSELVGLVPKAALLATGDHFLRKQGHTSGVPEKDRIRSAVVSLGLRELGPFDPGEKIIEHRVRPDTEALTALSSHELLDQISSDSPAPGGGSVAALCGALAASLTSMVAALTFKKKGWEGKRPEMEELGQSAQALLDWFRVAIDRDTDAFNALMTAIGLPGSNAAEKEHRDREMSAAALTAATVPLEVLEHAVTVLRLTATAAREGNPNSVSDAGVAAVCAEAAARGASLNVRINLPSVRIEDQGDISSRHDQAMVEVSALVAEVRASVDTALDS